MGPVHQVIDPCSSAMLQGQYVAQVLLLRMNQLLKSVLLQVTTSALKHHPDVEDGGHEFLTGRSFLRALHEGTESCCVFSNAILQQLSS